LKICFEKLEKEKKKKRKVGLFRISARRLGLPCRGPLTSPRPHSPAWAEPSRSRRPSIARVRLRPAAAAFSARAADLWVPPVSDTFPFPSPSSGAFQKRTPSLSFFHRSNPRLNLPISSLEAAFEL
jgi:hypothetical protein